MDARKFGYWATTGLGTAILTIGGTSELAHATRITETVAHLGYPAFLPSLLGAWKLLAVITILVPRFPRLKEWAYAGVFFDVTGAIISHGVVGDGAARLAPPLVVLALLATSWALRPASRVLGTIGALSTRDGTSTVHRASAGGANDARAAAPFSA